MRILLCLLYQLPTCCGVVSSGIISLSCERKITWCGVSLALLM